MLKQEHQSNRNENFEAMENDEFLSCTVRQSSPSTVSENIKIKYETVVPENGETNDSESSQRLSKGRDPLADFEPPSCSSNSSSTGRQDSVRSAKDNENIFKCTDCPEKFEKLNDLRAHKRIKHFKSKECEVCKELCTTYYQYVYHNEKHYGKVFKCTLCPKKFTKQSKLDEHKNAHTGATPYRCEKCNSGFRYRRSYMNHNIRKHLMVDDEDECEKNDKMYEHQCTFCEKGFQSKKSLAAHIRCFHTKTAINTCKKCKIYFVSCQKLERHQISVHGKKSPYQCTKCDRKPFNCKGDLTRHYKTHNNPNPNPNRRRRATIEVEENKNSVQRTINDRITRHIKSSMKESTSGKDKGGNDSNDSSSNEDEGPKIKKIKAELPDPLESNSNSNVEDDDSSQDKDYDDPNFTPRVTDTDIKILVQDFKIEIEPTVLETPNITIMSDLDTQNQEIINSLMNSNSNDQEQGSVEEDPKRKQKCQFCGMAFRDKYRVNEHERKHTGEKPFHCAKCNKYFTTRKSLRDHDLLHTNAYKTFCTVCGKGARDASFLRHHMKIHNEEKPFKCPTCNKGFTAAYTLTQHLQLHTGEKPFNCESCKKSFANKPALSKHNKRNHEPGTCKKRFQCSECNDTFGRKLNLNKHMVIVHGRTEDFSR